MLISERTFANKRNGHKSKRGRIMVDTLLTQIVQDADDGRRSVHVFLPAATSQADIVSFSNAYAALLDAVIDGVIVECNYTINIAVPGGLKGAAVANSEVEKGALLSYLNGSRYKYGMYVPTFTPSKFSGNDVNLGAAGVQAYVDAHSVGLGAIFPTNGYAFDLTGLSKAKKTFRK